MTVRGMIMVVTIKMMTNAMAMAMVLMISNVLMMAQVMMIAPLMMITIDRHDDVSIMAGVYAYGEGLFIIA